MTRTKYCMAILAGALGGAAAIGIMEFLSARTAFPLASIPFATSIVTVMGSPEAEPAQPRALVGGHLISAVVGLLVVKLAGPSSLSAAIAVGIAIAAMHLSGTFHPPAGINPLIIVLGDMPWSFMIVPVAFGAVILLAFAWLWHRVLWRRPWPAQWLQRAPIRRPAPVPVPPAHAVPFPATGRDGADEISTASNDARWRRSSSR
jgi:CBS-domain-containing membrane protein